MPGNNRGTLFSTPPTVVELGDSLAAAYCGRMLHQLGAHVITVESSGGSAIRSLPPFLDGPDGAPVSATHQSLTAGKEVVVADLTTPDGRRTIEALLRDRADVVLMSGTLTEWAERGLLPAQVREMAPRAVVGRITTFGDVGPYADHAGGELQAQALGGLMNMIGEPDAEPLRMGGFQAQYSAGLALLSGVSLALFGRSRTGTGSSFSTSVVETVAHVEWKTATTFQGGKITRRGSRQDPPLILRCLDGFFAFFYLPHDWPKVLAVVDDPRLAEPRFATQPGRDEHRDELVEILTEFTSQVPKVELYHRTQAAMMTTGYTATIGDLFEDQQYRSRQFFDAVEVAGLGSGLLPGSPWRAQPGSASPTPTPAAAPAVATTRASEVPQR